jgi:hypothetical protein
MQMSWRDHTISKIADSLIEYEAQCACLGQEINPKEQLLLKPLTKKGQGEDFK